jgi:hypothetical protein
LKDGLLRLGKFLLLAQTFELTPPGNEHGVFLLEGPLLIHSFGDFVTLLVGHLISKVLLQQIQKRQFLDKL